MLLAETAPLLHLLPASDTAQGELFVTLLARIIDGFGLEYTFQEDAAEMCLRLSGEEALRLSFYTKEDALLIASPMLEGYAFRLDVTEEDAAWLAAMVESGSFSDDAYTGGTQCATWTYPLGENAHLIIRSVTDDAGHPVGLSLALMQAETQLATLSIGYQQDTLTLVTGLGLNTRNYWCRLTCTESESGTISYLNGDMQEWLVPKAKSFASVAAQDTPVEVSKLRATVTQKEQTTSWSGKVCREDGVDTLCTFAGNYTPDTGAMNAVLRLGSSLNKNPLTLRFAMGEAETIAPLDDALLICSEAEEPVLYASLMEQLSTALAARMIKLLPMDIILQLVQYVSLP